MFHPVLPDRSAYHPLRLPHGGPGGEEEGGGHQGWPVKLYQFRYRSTVLYREDGKKKIFKEIKMREGFSWGLCKDS